MEHSIHEKVPEHKISLYSTLKGALGAHMPGLSLQQRLDVREWKLKGSRPPIFASSCWDICFERAGGKPFVIGECLNGVTDKYLINAREDVMFASPNQLIELRILVSVSSLMYMFTFEDSDVLTYGFPHNSIPSSLTRNCASASKLQDTMCRGELSFGTLLPWLNDATTRSG